jgi:hypothetical protein
MPPERPNPTPFPLRHKGPCGRRLTCWRPECRRAFGAYPTIEILPDVALAFCHRMAHPTDDPRVRSVAA